jgi:hypothetical protein
VSSQEAERTGVLVLRAWIEPHGPPLRVRITGRLDVHAADETSVTVAGAEVASRIVHDWLLQLEQPTAVAENGERRD